MQPILHYSRSIRYRISILLLTGILLVPVFCAAVALGPVRVPFAETLKTLFGFPTDPRFTTIIWNIRLPQTLAAVLAGAGLGISGAVMQSVLRNPLCSPFTLGISNAAAFGAALALFFGGAASGKESTALSAFLFAMLTTLFVLAAGRIKGTQSETLILLGAAFASLFSAGMMFLQYLSDDVRLAAIVYWMFGDTSRAAYPQLLLIALSVVPVSVYFLFHCWNYNALMLGDETAKGLGVPIQRLRVLTMLLTSLLTAVLVSLLGIIGFVGLVVPHIARLLVGSDYRFLLPFSLLFGGLLLLVADTAARLCFAPRTLPVAVLTAFVGVPVFLLLLFKNRQG
ncbi:MAG: iron ABC transporter permease [Planctomycetaceae bacterium]|jgi:iron complex transport system permease protein|nr:iron ABC transporter permease [Planctomycetaceae bacterium]